jgi:hypothetical protein
LPANRFAGSNPWPSTNAPAGPPAAGGTRASEPSAELSPVERARAIRRATGLPWRDRVILLEISDYQGENGACWAKQTTMARDLGVDARNLRRAITALAAAGWITRGRDRQGLHTYRVTIPVEQGHQSSVAGLSEPSSLHPAEPIKEGRHDPVAGSPEPQRVTTTRVVTTRRTGLSRPGGQGCHDPEGRVVTTLQGTNHGTNHGTNQEQQPAALRAAPAPAKAEAPSVQRQIAQFEVGLDAELCADVRAACALSRRHGKMADAAWLKTLAELTKHPPPLAKQAMRTYADRHADGDKDERYLFGILRGLAKGGRSGGRFGAGGMLPESTDFGASPDEENLASLFGARGAHV